MNVFYDKYKLLLTYFYYNLSLSNKFKKHYIKLCNCIRKFIDL